MLSVYSGGAYIYYVVNIVRSILRTIDIFYPYSNPIYILVVIEHVHEYLSIHSWGTSTVFQDARVSASFKF